MNDENFHGQLTPILPEALNAIGYAEVVREEPGSHWLAEWFFQDWLRVPRNSTLAGFALALSQDEELRHGIGQVPA